MGATTFTNYHDGADADTAFNAACRDARYEYGHGGYTGTLAEKYSYVIVTQTLMTYDEACDHANHLLDTNDHRIDDKWGPAGAIPVKTDHRTVAVDDIPASVIGTLIPYDLERITRIARTRDLITDGETVASGWVENRYQPNNRFPVQVAHLTVTRNAAELAAQTKPDGWLFFGWASS
ncbi:hypothetical protein [Actinoplanes couchii]|uniref:Uncharacterized protein n=1 Tax=Actinoplanes couchii TaxID=403638 RepID=A0ABQ3XSS6_9ACTN|nr:hypothetical protein [Actinoplanes couchii]MDR6324035.1 hypothetical protein [Actinoplanes couchii]GID61562.1 hypothetical protein Aco03nite_099660 [Actinoplanes couchii]